MPAEVEDRLLRALRECVIAGGRESCRRRSDAATTIGASSQIGCAAEICQLAAEFPEKVFFVDSRTRIGTYHHVTIKPNRFEAKRAVDPELGWRRGRYRGGQAMWADLDGADRKAAICNRWSAGHLGIPRWTGVASMCRASRLKRTTDPVGAGDSVSAAVVGDALRRLWPP